MAPFRFGLRQTAQPPKRGWPPVETIKPSAGCGKPAPEGDRRASRCNASTRCPFPWKLRRLSATQAKVSTRGRYASAEIERSVRCDHCNQNGQRNQTVIISTDESLRWNERCHTALSLRSKVQSGLSAGVRVRLDLRPGKAGEKKSAIRPHVRQTASARVCYT